MDTLSIVQIVEVVMIFAYVIASRKHHEDFLTQVGLLCVAVVLSIDVFTLHRHRPDWFRDIINIFSGVICYEKIFRKYGIVFFTSLLGR